MVLADNKNASLLDINKVLPKTVTIVENPIQPRAKKMARVTYSPQQKAQIVGLELKSK